MSKQIKYKYQNQIVVTGFYRTRPYDACRFFIEAVTIVAGVDTAETVRIVVLSFAFYFYVLAASILRIALYKLPKVHICDSQKHTCLKKFFQFIEQLFSM